VGKLFIIHTTPVTVAALKELAAEMIPGHQVFNILDDSILPELIAGAPLTQVEPRVRRYVRSAAEGGADVILSACSSIGGLVVAAQGEVAVPVVRIDGAMAEQAVEMGTVIAVAATLDTTLQPTTELLKEKGAILGKEIVVQPYLVEGAYAALAAGDRGKHDALVGEALGKAYQETDVVVLAQASMAGVVDQLAGLDGSRFLTSPRLGMAQVKAFLEKSL
jgi:Asp/Glu/hydantoin racemase